MQPRFHVAADFLPLVENFMEDDESSDVFEMDDPSCIKVFMGLFSNPEFHKFIAAEYFDRGLANDDMRVVTYASKIGKNYMHPSFISQRFKKVCKSENLQLANFMLRCFNITRDWMVTSDYMHFKKACFNCKYKLVRWFQEKFSITPDELRPYFGSIIDTAPTRQYFQTTHWLYHFGKFKISCYERAVALMFTIHGKHLARTLIGEPLLPYTCEEKIGYHLHKLEENGAWEDEDYEKIIRECGRWSKPIQHDYRRPPPQ